HEFLRGGSVTILAYVAKNVKKDKEESKVVYMISSAHHDRDITSSHAGKETSKPTIIVDYNRRKPAVDKWNQQNRSSTVKQISTRWTSVMLCNTIDCAKQNAYKIHRHLDPEWHKKHPME